MSSPQEIIHRAELVDALAQTLGLSVAKTLIAERAERCGLQGKTTYTMPEFFRLSGLLVREGGLVGAVAQSFINRVLRKSQQQAQAAADDAERDRLEVIQSINVGIVLLDAETNQILDINPRALDMLGLTRPEAHMLPSFWRLLSDLPAPPEHIPEQSINNAEVMLRHQRGYRIPVLLSLRTLQQRGRPALLTTFVEISDQKRVERQLRVATQVAEEANRAKTAFLANMSHELRTPLNAVLGFSELLEDSGMDPVQLDYIQSIRESGRLLLNVISNILDLTKIEAGASPLEEIPFELPELLRACLNIIRPRVKKPAVDLLLELGDGLPKWVLGDPTRVQQVLVNLLANAAEYTSEGHIRLSARVSSPATADLAPSIVEIAVEDTGEGIAKEAQQHVFEAFRQADESTTRRHGGTGLGLAVCQAFINTMGGWIRLESKLGEGSTFYCSIPLTPTTAPEPAEAKEDTQSLRLKGLRVLVAEDNPLNQKLIHRMLRRMGCEVTLVEDGEEAVSASQGGDFSACLMDLQMPKMGGIEAAEQIRNQGNSALPIIALTANALREDMERCYAVGMDDYLVKPASGSQIAEKIRTWAGRRKS